MTDGNKTKKFNISKSRASQEKAAAAKIPPQKKQETFDRLRGMKDVLFDDWKYFSLVKKKAGELAKAYSFRRLETPILENAKLYERSSGNGSDLVTKEMYSFLDKGGDKIALRPEGTPSIVRAYIEHGMFTLPQPIKTFWYGSLFRYEKPQSGRYREHHQINFDVFGEAKPMADAQLILLAYNFFKELQIDIQVQINSIGCPLCRPNYLKQLVEYYQTRGKRSKLCVDCKKRLIKNPLRLLDCKEETCIELAVDAPQLVDCLCEDCKNHFVRVLEYLDLLAVPYNLNSHLVRGLDYYNRTVFEFTPTGEEERRQLSLGGGGRYDYLVEFMGGRATPAIGFGIGVERVVSRVRNMAIPMECEEKYDVFVAQLGEASRQKAMTLFEELRRANIKVKEAFTKENLKSQLEDADRAKVRYALILGQKELMDGTILIRDMESGIQEVVDFKKILHEIDKRLNNQ